MLVALVTAVIAGAADAQTGAAHLVVGTKDAPPFAMRGEDGRWHGISIELWEDLAAKLGVTFEYRETDLKGLLDGVASGDLDVAVAALTITPERERGMDFSHPFYTTGLGIAVAAKPARPWLGTVRAFFSLAFLRVIAVLALVLLAFGFAVWWVERKRNAAQFGGTPLQGIGSGFWWSAVTMTTVGYGDKAPLTLAGRLIALVWMFSGLIAISGFTAAITATLTVSQLESPVQGPDDLAKVRVGAVADSTGETYLRSRQLLPGSYPHTSAGLERVAGGQLDAFVHDAPLLRYLVKQHHAGVLAVLDKTFSRQDYGIALPTGSALRETLNRELLQAIRGEPWLATLRRYLGE